MKGWTEDATEHEYDAAGVFLDLLLPKEVTAATLSLLRRAPIEHRQAKDLLRASGLDALPVDNPKVAAKLRKLESGKRLAPVLLVRGNLLHGSHLIIADGFHRICAGMALKPGTLIPCKLVDLPVERAVSTVSGGTSKGRLSTARQ
ncbi:MAG: hypothetical protein J2O47_07050 [Acidimicrobiaceae bacterium]|nr:hypothetical protein [Acidimicrobiaceae bacterium]